MTVSVIPFPGCLWQHHFSHHSWFVPAHTKHALYTHFTETWLHPSHSDSNQPTTKGKMREPTRAPAACMMLAGWDFGKFNPWVASGVALGCPGVPQLSIKTLYMWRRSTWQAGLTYMVVFPSGGWDQWLWKSLAELFPRSPLAYMVEIHVTNAVSVPMKWFSVNEHISKTQHRSPKGAKACASKQKSDKNQLLKNKLLLKSHFLGKEQKRGVPWSKQNWPGLRCPAQLPRVNVAMPFAVLCTRDLMTSKSETE